MVYRVYICFRGLGFSAYVETYRVDLKVLYSMGVAVFTILIP